MLNQCLTLTSNYLLVGAISPFQISPGHGILAPFREQRLISLSELGRGDGFPIPPASRGPALCCVDFRTPQVLCSMLPGPLVLGAFDSFFSFLVSILLLVLWFRMECPSARGPLLSTQLFLLFFIFESCPTTNFPFLSVASW